MKILWFSAVALILSLAGSAAHAAAFQAPMVSAYTASLTSFERGKTVRVGTTVTVRTGLTKPGTVTLTVKDVNGTVVTSYRTAFTAASANSSLQVAGDFPTTAASPSGAYALEVNIVSPEVNVTAAKGGVFSVTVPASERATYKVTMGEIVVGSKTLRAGGRLSYYIDITPNKAMPSPGSVTLTVTNANKQVVDAYSAKFTSVPVTGFRATRDVVLPLNLAIGNYTITAVGWSPEFAASSRVLANAFQVTNVLNGACGGSANTVVTDTPANVCASGTPTAVSLANNTYSWSCAGGPGGTTASCQAPRATATCGTANQQAFGNTPRTGLCAVGLPTAVQWSPASYYWGCADAVSATQVSCSARYTAPAFNLTAYEGAGTDGLNAIARFNGWLGREMDYYLINLNQTNWSALLSSVPWAASSLPQDKRLVVSVPMLVAQDYSGTFWIDNVAYRDMVMPKGTLAQGAAGAFDSYFAFVAQTLVKYGRGNAVVRLGWEMNGSWQPWRAAADPASYVAFYQRIVQVMRAVPGANFEFDWCPNIHTQEINPELVYPGDAYVDYIGQDVYDSILGPTVVDPVARWTYFYAAPNGIKWGLDFAAAHGKKKSFPEWGGGGGYTGRGVGDSALFIDNMAAVFKANNVSYAGYWDSNAAYQGMLSANQYPLMGSSFKTQFGAVAQ